MTPDPFITGESFTNEYPAFYKWFEETYGAEKARERASDVFGQWTRPEYRNWRSQGRPYYKEPVDVTVGGEGFDVDAFLAGVGEEEAMGAGLADLTIGDFETIVQNGRVLLVLRDKEGNILDVQDIGAAEPEGLTDYQQATIDYNIRALEEEREYRQASLALQEETARWQREEARRKEEARLAASPISWLQHAAFTGQTPVVQPWMKPLMAGQYGDLGVGEEIPGITTPGGVDYANLPGLTTPSRQYQARMGPTGLQQYLGYQQAQTGARPEETQWRLWSSAPPSGSYRGLSHAR